MRASSDSCTNATLLYQNEGAPRDLLVAIATARDLPLAKLLPFAAAILITLILTALRHISSGYQPAAAKVAKQPFVSLKSTKLGLLPPSQKARLPPEAKLPRPEALDPIPGSGFQWVQGLT